jgi:hypothetical protein
VCGLECPEKSSTKVLPDSYTPVLVTRGFQPKPHLQPITSLYNSPSHRHAVPRYNLSQSEQETNSEGKFRLLTHPIDHFCQSSSSHQQEARKTRLDARKSIHSLRTIRARAPPSTLKPNDNSFSQHKLPNGKFVLGPPEQRPLLSAFDPAEPSCGSVTNPVQESSPTFRQEAQPPLHESIVSRSVVPTSPKPYCSYIALQGPSPPDSIMSERPLLQSAPGE